MPQLKELKEDVLLTVRIELERMFTVLANKYHRTPDDKHEPVLREIETKLKESLNLIEQS